MKALTLTQPWASLVASGHKTIETRSWSTSYRGPLAIHAAKTWPTWAKHFWRDNRQHVAVIDLLPRTLPLGAIIATCVLVDVVSTDCSVAEVGRERTNRIEREKLLGDYSAHRFMWFLESVRAPEEPIPAVGHLSLWEWPVPYILRADPVEAR